MIPILRIFISNAGILFLFLSIKISIPSLFINCARCVALLPGAAHISIVISLGFGSRITAGNIEAIF
ncbi:hypothetical protein ES703_78212 [subsurface metagenome]